MVLRALDESREPYCARIAPPRALASAPAASPCAGSAGGLQSSRGMDPGVTPSTGASAAMARDSAKARRVGSLTMESPLAGERCCVPADGRDRPEERRAPG